MKKICITLALLAIIIVTAACGAGSGGAEKAEYLRIHIRAASNADDDQRVKYLVRDAIVDLITPTVAECHSKSEAISRLNGQKSTIEYVAGQVLAANGKFYGCRAKITGEYFPTRVYDGTTLEAGYYDAVILELGEGKGDNWWCVVYPPLCFIKEENVRYRSKIAEIIEEFRKKFGGTQ